MKWLLTGSYSNYQQFEYDIEYMNKNDIFYNFKVAYP